MPKPLLLILLCTWLAPAVFAQTLPAIPSPQLWLKANGGTVSSSLWTDMSGNRRHATAGAEGPTAKDTLNFNPTVVFNGLQHSMKIPYSLEGFSELSIVAVFQSADTLERGVLGTENFLSRKVSLSTARVTGPDSAIAYYGNHGGQAVIGAVVQHWDVAGALSNEAFLSLGRAGKGLEVKPFKGSIAEILIYDRALSFLERQQVKTYLAVKYGIALAEGNYLSAAQEVLWHGEQNKNWGHHITGIGRDDAFALHQKQSRSVQDTSRLLLLSAGTLAPTNEANRANLANGDFLIWGDNGLLPTARKGQGQDSLLSMLERTWLMQVSGTTASQLPTELRLDLSRLPHDSLGYWLVIDRSGQGNFSAENLEYVPADSVSPHKIAFYRQLRWDTDGSGRDHFGFARARELFAVAVHQINPNCENQNGGSSSLRVVGGKAPYRYELQNPSAKISRRWEGASISEQKNLPAGQYTLRVKDANQLEAQWIFNLALPNTLLVELGPDQELYDDEPLYLDAGSLIPDSIPASYAWESNFGFKSKERQITVKETGIYTVTVTNAEGCTFQDQLVVSGGDKQRYAVFPSLLRSGKTLNMSLSMREAGAVQLTIRNLNGMLAQQFQGEGSSEYHFTTTLREAGMYLVVFETPQGTKTKRFVVY